MDRWERKLATRDTNRVVRPFEWGTDWLHGIGFPSARLKPMAMRQLAWALSPTRQWPTPTGSFPMPRPATTSYDDGRLTFTSPVETRYSENNTVHALWFPTPRDRQRALVLLPQWNSDAGGHVGLAKLLNRFGISALRMTMAYHAERMPEELRARRLPRSSNIGRTIHAARQSIIDVRACIDWLAAQGYERVGILGTSLGSCVAFIAAAHDPRIKVGIFNHVSMYFSDVVWTGLSTQHVRRGFGDVVAQDDLRRYWVPSARPVICIACRNGTLRSLLIWARHDSSFLPVYSQEVLRAFRELELAHEVLTLPCGHYTTGQFPFNLMDGLAMCRFAAKNM